MSEKQIVILPDERLPVLTVTSIPAIVSNAGQPAINAWKDFFDGKIANENTRVAYNRAIQQFLKWCVEQDIELVRIMAGDVGRYLREKQVSLPTKKQHLAALRRFFNLLVERHIVVINPAAVAETERMQVVEGKTPEISIEQARQLLLSINIDTVVGLRDRAIIATLIYTAARAGAVAKLKVDHFYNAGDQWMLHFDDKGGKSREIPVRYDLQKYLLEYIEAAGLQNEIKGASLFRTAIRKEKRLTAIGMTGFDIYRMLKRKLQQGGISIHLMPHSFRVAAATDLLVQGIPLEDVQHLLGHADPRTTRLYDRRGKKITRNIVERISI